MKLFEIFVRCQNIEGLIIMGKVKKNKFQGDFFFMCKNCGKIRKVKQLSSVINSNQTGLCRLCYLESKKGINDDKLFIVKELRKNGCSICGYNKYDCALSFHHVDSKEKNFCINGVGTHSVLISIKSFLEEINKCVLVCSNCHKMLHLKKLPKF